MPNASSREHDATPRDERRSSTQGPRLASVATTPGTEPGLVLKTTLMGWFAVGAHDPYEGARAGRARGTALRLRATMYIPDVPGFMDDEEHAALLGGAVDFAPLGFDLPALHGDVRLFAPDPIGGKCMVLGLAFTHDDGSYFLSAERHLGGGFRPTAWGDSLTIPARLHRGQSGGCSVMAAGMLRLDPLRVIGSISTARGTGSDKLGRISAPFRFGRFLAGELWDSLFVRREQVAD